MRRLFLAFLFQILSTFAISWNDNMCQIYIEHEVDLILKDIRSNTTIPIDTLAHPSYIKFETVVQIFFSHDDQKVMDIVLLEATELENCPYRIMQGRNLASICNQLTTCTSCMVESVCKWNSVSGSCQDTYNLLETWYDKATMCITDYGQSMHPSCPETIRDSQSNSFIVAFPKTAATMPTGTFCYVKIPARKDGRIIDGKIYNVILSSIVEKV